MVPFCGDRYESIYQAMVSLMDELEKNAYHGAKLKALLKEIATDGRLVDLITPFHSTDFIFRSQNIKRRANPKAHGFKIRLD
jgi:hypothetical protein